LSKAHRNQKFCLKQTKEILLLDGTFLFIPYGDSKFPKYDLDRTVVRIAPIDSSRSCEFFCSIFMSSRVTRKISSKARKLQQKAKFQNVVLSHFFFGSVLEEAGGEPCAVPQVVVHPIVFKFQRVSKNRFGSKVRANLSDWSFFPHHGMVISLERWLYFHDKTHRHTHRDTQTDTQTRTETHTDTRTETHRDTNRHAQRHKQTHRDMHRDTQRHALRHTQRHV